MPKTPHKQNTLNTRAYYIMVGVLLVVGVVMVLVPLVYAGGV